MFRLRRWSYFVFASVLYLALAATASAQVVVTVDGDTAYATISLTGDNGQTYGADVTIVFDSPLNLSPESLNLTAEIIDPTAINPRLPLGGASDLVCGGDVEIDPAFPVIITVEPLDIPWLFSAGFDGGGSSGGGLEFINTYSFEIHTHDLVYQNGSPYRVYKAPLGEDFFDITEDVQSGSVRARGRHGAFSQFVIASDTRGHRPLGLPLPVLCSVYNEKLVRLTTLITDAILGDVLRLDLLNLVAKITTLLLVDLNSALAAVDELIGIVDADAGTEIANVWRASRDVSNDAGEMKGTAVALRYAIEAEQGVANP